MALGERGEHGVCERGGRVLHACGRVRVAATPGRGLGDGARFEQPGPQQGQSGNQGDQHGSHQADVEERTQVGGQGRSAQTHSRGRHQGECAGGPQADGQASQGCGQHGRAHGDADLVSVAGVVAARFTQKHHAKTLTKQAAAKPPMRARAGKVTNATTAPVAGKVAPARNAPR